MLIGNLMSTIAESISSKETESIMMPHPAVEVRWDFEEGRLILKSDERDLLDPRMY